MHSLPVLLVVSLVGQSCSKGQIGHDAGEHCLAPDNQSCTNEQAGRNADAVEPFFSPIIAETAKACGFGSDRVVMRNGTTGIRGIFAVGPFSKGVVVGMVPLAASLLAEQRPSEACSAPGAPWASLNAGPIPNFTALQSPHDGPLPSSVRIALALLDVAQGDGGEFWKAYSKLLPGPDELDLPLTTPSEKIDDPILASEMQSQRAELQAYCPRLFQADGDVGFGQRGLLWAVANVRSRAFGVSPKLLGFVPFIDLINHAAKPSAELAADAEAVAPLDGEQAGFIKLVALRDIAAGEEITITYGEELTNYQLFASYGFRMPGN